MKKTRLAVILLFICFNAVGQETPEKVRISVDLNSEIGELNPFWAWFGYDEPNYTYMKDGKKLLSELSALSPVPVYVRTHNLLTSGDGKPGTEMGIDKYLYRRY